MSSLSIDLEDLQPGPRPWFEELLDDNRKFYENMGYSCVCKIHGKTVGLMQFIFTVGIVVGMDETGYEYRYCYHTGAEAFVALANWIIKGEEEPSGYIKRKG